MKFRNAVDILNDIVLRVDLSLLILAAMEYLSEDYKHYSDVIMSVMVSQITNLTIVYLTVYSGGDQTKHQSSVSLAFVWGIHRWSVNLLIAAYGIVHMWLSSASPLLLLGLEMIDAIWVAHTSLIRFAGQLIMLRGGKSIPYSE